MSSPDPQEGAAPPPSLGKPDPLRSGMEKREPSPDPDSLHVSSPDLLEKTAVPSPDLQEGAAPPCRRMRRGRAVAGLAGGGGCRLHLVVSTSLSMGMKGKVIVASTPLLLVTHAGQGATTRRGATSPGRHHADRCRQPKAPLPNPSPQREVTAAANIEGGEGMRGWEGDPRGRGWEGEGRGCRVDLSPM